mgnify:CR=1 FL=1
MQVAPEQQPSGQVPAVQPLHVPAVQLWPPGHGWQAPPPVPHELAVSPVRQAPFEQQPFGHEVPSQTQVLPMQRCPGAQAASAPVTALSMAERISSNSIAGAT